MILRILLIATFLGSACKSSHEKSGLSDSSDVPPGSSSPLLMSANVENAFDATDQGSEYDSHSGKTSNWIADGMAEKKAKRVAKVFNQECPLIIVSPEVENLASAKAIASTSRCKYTAYFGADPASPQPVGVAIFTALPVKSVQIVPLDPRPALRIEFTSGLVVYGVHLKSPRDGGEELRQKAGIILTEHVKAHPGRRIIVAGDFNTAEDLLGSVLKECSSTAKPSYYYQGAWSHFDKVYSSACGKEVKRAEYPFLYTSGGTPFRSVLRHAGNRFIHEDEGYSDHIPLILPD